MSKVSGAASPSESAGTTTEQGQAVLRCAGEGGVNLDYSSDLNPLPGPCHRVLNDYNVKEIALLPKKGLSLRR